MKLFEKLDRITTVRSTFISFVFFLINAIWLMVAGNGLTKYSSSPKVDFQLGGYDIAFINRLFTEYGLEGRNYYFWLTVLDTPFPFFVGIFGALYFSLTWRRWKLRWLGNFLILCSFSFFIFDNIENAMIYRMLTDFPALSSIEVTISSISTQIKLLSLFCIYLFLPITLIISIIRKVRQK